MDISKEIVGKSLFMAVIAGLFLSLGFIIPASTPVLLNGSINYTAFLNPILIFPVIALAIISLGIDKLFSTGLKIGQAVLGSIAVVFYTQAASPSTSLLSSGGLAAVLSMTFIWFVAAMITKTLMKS